MVGILRWEKLPLVYAINEAARLRGGFETTRARRRCLTLVNNAFTLLFVIRSFASPETQGLFVTGKSRRLPPEIRKRAAVRLTQLDAATTLNDLRFPPSNRLEALKDDRKGQWSIRINDQWRICFRFENGDAFDVEIVDYH